MPNESPKTVSDTVLTQKANSGPEAARKEDDRIFPLTPGLTVCYNDYWFYVKLALNKAVLIRGCMM